MWAAATCRTEGSHEAPPPPAIAPYPGLAAAVAVRVGVVTTEAGNIEGSQGIAVGQSAQAQTVTINLPSLEERPRNLTQYMDALWKIVIVDQNERRARQEETDHHRQEMRADIKEIGGRIDRLEAFVMQLSQQARIAALVLGVAVAVALWGIWQLAMRLGVW